MVVLNGHRIVAKVGEWFDFPAINSDQAIKRTFDGPWVVRMFPQPIAVKCTDAGTGTIKVEYANGTSETFSVLCVGVIRLAIDASLNVDQYFGLDVSWVTQSSGLVDIASQYGDHIITCVAEGSGTLWVAFTGSANDYYDLECSHDQGGGW
jgi:hypothetical protein